ncbi:hypothetical protein HY338_01005 [Candidatus Gottesmanbacteria bacterium]|nr:hypothetical protein [Candidatus Gottesmanbacteria bacterium]
MKLNINTEKITTSSNENYWGGVFCENGLFLALEVKGDATKPAPKSGREYIDLLLTRFTNHQEINLDVVRDLLGQIAKTENTLSLIVGLLDKDNLYLGSYKKGIAYMVRSEKLGKILTPGNITSGEVVTGDVIILYSEDLNAIIDQTKRKTLFTKENLEVIKDELLAQVLDKPEAYGKAVILISIGNWEKEEESMVEMPPETKPQDEPVPQEEPKKFMLWPRVVAGFKLVKEKWQQTAIRPETKSKKNLLTVAIVLIMLLFSSIFFNINHSRNSKKTAELDKVMELITQQYDEAVSLIDLNSVRSRELLSASKLSLSPYLNQFPKGSSEYKKVQEWLDKITSQETTAYKIYKLTAVPLFFDLNLIKKDGTGTKITNFNETTAILDSQNKIIYSLKTDSKKAEVVAGSDIVKDGAILTIHGTNIYLLNSDGVVAIDMKSKTSKIVVKKDDKWGNIKSMASFGGNLYLLDSQNHAIWKYIATDFGFSARSNYLNPDVRVNFASAETIIIDGSIWVGKDIEILKFAKGLGEDFSFKGISDSIQNVTNFYTSDSDKYLYLLDKPLSRIVVFDKDGVYQSQYQWDDLKNADGIIASESEKKIFVMIGSKIYAIDLL